MLVRADAGVTGSGAGAGGEMGGISFRHIEHVVGSNLLGNVIMRIILASYVLLR